MSRVGLAYTQGEVTSQVLWSRYDRHFVGMNAVTSGDKRRRFIVSFESDTTSLFKEVSI